MLGVARALRLAAPAPLGRPEPSSSLHDVKRREAFFGRGANSDSYSSRAAVAGERVGDRLFEPNCPIFRAVTADSFE
eukprot:3742216-Rhodomonas_salina.2